MHIPRWMKMVKATPPGEDGLIISPYFHTRNSELNENAKGVYYESKGGHNRGSFMENCHGRTCHCVKKMLE